MKCENCKHHLKGGPVCGLCYCYDRFEPKDYPPYLDYPKERKPITNADRIRTMTDEELADYFAELSCWPNAGREDCRGMAKCMDCWLDWLRREAGD